MKKILCMFMVMIFLLTGFAGCTAVPTQEETASTPTEATQSPEEAAVYKVLLIGQSLGQDTVWLLQTVLKTEMPDQEFLVADIYRSIGLGDHRANILNNASVYDYYKLSDGGIQHMQDVSIAAALRDEMWDLIIFNDTTYATTQAMEFEDGDHAFMINYIRETAAPGYKLAYNATGANPTDPELWAPGRNQPPEIVHERFLTVFGGSRNVYYDMICANIEKYIETNEEFDYVFHTGTAIQYASETHGVPEADPAGVYDLYRDYVHLSDFGRLIVAYQIYAQIYGLEKLEDVKVDVIKANMRATSREKMFGDLEITQQHKEAIIASVNFALANPNKVPEQTARPEAVLESLPK